jgi:hypothetical protein
MSSSIESIGTGLSVIISGAAFWPGFILFAACLFGAWALLRGIRNDKNKVIKVIVAAPLICFALLLGTVFALSLAYYSKCPGGSDWTLFGGGNTCIDKEGMVFRQNEERLEKQAEKARMLCGQTQADGQPRFSAGSCGIRLEDEGLGSNEMMTLLSDKNVGYLEFRVFPGQDGRGRILACRYDEQGWAMDQPPGAYVRLEVAAKGTPGCVDDYDLPESVMTSWINARSDPGAPIGKNTCLRVGYTSAPVAPLRLDLKAGEPVHVAATAGTPPYRASWRAGLPPGPLPEGTLGYTAPQPDGKESAPITWTTEHLGGGVTRHVPSRSRLPDDPSRDHDIRAQRVDQDCAGGPCVRRQGRVPLSEMPEAQREEIVRQMREEARADFIEHGGVYATPENTARADANAWGQPSPSAKPCTPAQLEAFDRAADMGTRPPDCRRTPTFAPAPVASGALPAASGAASGALPATDLPVRARVNDAPMLGL